MEKKHKIRSMICLCILDKLSRKNSNSLKEMIIIYQNDQYIIVNKKYKFLCNIIMKKYQKLENNKNYGIVKFASTLLLLSTMNFLVKENKENILAKNSSKIEGITLENEENKLTNLVENYSNELHEDINETLDIEIIESVARCEAKTEIIQEEAKEIEKQFLYESYLKEYCYYYNLDNEKVINLARSVTNNYESFESIIDDNQFDLSNPEASCMLFVYFLTRDELLISLEELGTTKEELIISDEIRKLTYETTEDLILTNGDKYSVYVGKICDLFGAKDKKMMLSMSFAEMGKQGSDVSRNKNNFAGLTDLNNNLITYPSPEAGIIAMCGNFKKRYDNYTLNNIDKLAGMYVMGKENISNEYTLRWIKNVSIFYSKISENYDWYFGNNTKNKEEVMTLSLTK